jgi:hypothetical protein
MVLKALGPDHEIDYDGDEYTVHARLPLLRNQAQTMLNLTYLAGMIRLLCDS